LFNLTPGNGKLHLSIKCSHALFSFDTISGPKIRKPSSGWIKLHHSGGTGLNAKAMELLSKSMTNFDLAVVQIFLL